MIEEVRWKIHGDNKLNWIFFEKYFDVVFLGALRIFSRLGVLNGRFKK